MPADVGNSWHCVALSLWQYPTRLHRPDWVMKPQASRGWIATSEPEVARTPERQKSAESVLLDDTDDSGDHDHRIVFQCMRVHWPPGMALSPPRNRTGYLPRPDAPAPMGRDWA